MAGSKEKITTINVYNLSNAIKTIKEREITIFGGFKHTGLSRTTMHRHLKYCMETGDDANRLHNNFAVNHVLYRIEERNLVNYIKDTGNLDLVFSCHLENTCTPICR